MSQAKVLVQHDAMADGKAAVHPIDEQEYQPCNVARTSVRVHFSAS